MTENTGLRARRYRRRARNPVFAFYATQNQVENWMMRSASKTTEKAIQPANSQRRRDTMARPTNSGNMANMKRGIDISGWIVEGLNSGGTNKTSTNAV